MSVKMVVPAVNLVQTPSAPVLLTTLDTAVNNVSEIATQLYISLPQSLLCRNGMCKHGLFLHCLVFGTLSISAVLPLELQCHSQLNGELLIAVCDANIPLLGIMCTLNENPLEQCKS